MNALGAYLITKSLEGRPTPKGGYPANDPLDGAPEPRPGLGTRVRKLFPRPRVAREPGFAAANWLDDVIPKLSAYPYPNTLR